MKMRNFIAEQRKLRGKRVEVAMKEMFACEVRKPEIETLRRRYRAQLHKCRIEEALLRSIEAQWDAREKELQK